MTRVGVGSKLVRSGILVDVSVGREAVLNVVAGSEEVTGPVVESEAVMGVHVGVGAVRSAEVESEAVPDTKSEAVSCSKALTGVIGGSVIAISVVEGNGMGICVDIEGEADLGAYEEPKSVEIKNGVVLRENVESGTVRDVEVERETVTGMKAVGDAVTCVVIGGEVRIVFKSGSVVALVGVTATLKGVEVRLELVMGV